MNKRYPLKTILVTGNGFDLDLRLKTRYSDFVKSKEWIEMYEQHVSNSNCYSLLNYLNERGDWDNWFDIEQSLLDYASIENKKIWKRDVNKDKMDYSVVCETLRDYLYYHILSSSHNISDYCAAKVLMQLVNNNEMRKIYTFNYTDLDLIMRVMGYNGLFKSVHIHGSVEDKTLVLGIEGDNINIMPEYSFLIKTNNNNYRENEIEQDMMNANEVIIFGHSLNMIDAVYFKDYLCDLSSNVNHNRKLTIITYNEDSKLALLDNIRKMEISVPKLFLRGHLEILLTDKIEREKDEDHVNRFDELLKRIYL